MDSNDLSGLLGDSSSGGSDLLGINSLMQSLAPFLILLTVLSIVFTIAYAWSIYQRWRVNHAIIEIRDMLRDMKATMQPPTPPSPESQPSHIESATEPQPEQNNTPEKQPTS